MELRHLQSFVAAADELHFGRAAARLYLSTSTLSDHIRGLERDLGVALFDRSHRGVALTTAGCEFLVEVRRVLAVLDTARSVAMQRARAGDGPLRLGWPASGNPAWAELIYAEYRAAHPEIPVELVVGHSGPHAHAVANGSLDVAFVSEPQETVPALRFRTLRRGPLGLACAVTHPLAHLPAITVGHLRSVVHVAFPRTVNPPLYRRVYEQLLDGAPHLLEHATSLEAVLGIVATGAAVALRLEESLPAMTCHPVVYRPLAVPGVEVDFGLTWRRTSAEPMVQQFVSHAISVSRLPDYPNCPAQPNGHPELPD